jgi:hypothetical protein
VKTSTEALIEGRLVADSQHPTLQSRQPAGVHRASDLLVRPPRRQ